MDIILSISSWYNFIVERLLFDAVSVPVTILIGFAVFKRKEYKNTQMLHFILTALAVSLISRYIYFVYAEMKINTRYLFPSAFYIVILGVPGFMLALRLLDNITKRTIWITKEHLVLFLLLAIGTGSIWKALNPPERKLYIHDTAKILNAVNSPVLVSNLQDSNRIAWHSNAQLILLSSVINSSNPIYFQQALNTLGLKNKNIFIIVEYENEEFENYFSHKGIKFPTGLKLLREFKEKHRKFYSLYKFETKIQEIK